MFHASQWKTFRVFGALTADKIPHMNGLHDRIRERLKALSKSPRRASLDSQLSQEAIGKILKKPDQSQTLETVGKLADGLETTPEYLAYGIGPAATQISGGNASSILDSDKPEQLRIEGILVDREDLSLAIAEALKLPNIREVQARILAQTAIELLSVRRGKLRRKNSTVLPRRPAGSVGKGSDGPER